MSDPSPDRVARELQESLGLLVRRLRQVRVVADLSQPESTALRGLVSRSVDPGDGRRVLLRPTVRGRRLAGAKRDARAEQLAGILAEHFGPDERARLLAAAPLLVRLAKAL